MKLSVVMPVFNELATVREIVARVAAVDVGMELELVLVDDGSTDGTRDLYDGIVAEHAPIPVLVELHERNRGKGAALRTGFARTSGDIVLVQDADLEYDPGDYTRLLGPILDGRADVVYGSRFVGSEEHRVLYFWHMVGNRMLTTMSNIFTDLNLTDMETCYKVFRREVVDQIKLVSERFDIEPEITARVAKGRWRIYEVGISYSGRDYAEGKKIGVRDGFEAVWAIVKYNTFG
ncbi:MAG: glycosyltransferase family 2 protein [Myxococcota bacterium]|nr:glycosyltransferase family 2 protein [Myxococcota bacterium]